MARGGAHRCQMAGRAMAATVVRRDGAVAVVAVGGEIDVQTAGRLRADLLTLIDGGHIHLVVDFEAVRFCDAAGLGVLVAVANRLREKGGTLCLARVRPAQRRILRITRLDELFPTYDTVDEAFQH
ncbi:anti-sigma factor antagonist BldG [Actinoallomurus vinaceus]|uniref:Anti-sigma factor antagonist n=2 Tax=Actinoallomurus vinaceus TaxID=1080074 RepID=A0ABP8UMN3_9ACTN